MGEIDDTSIDGKLWWLARRAKRIGVVAGYLWLYENGFGHRVPEEIRKKIEDAKLKDVFKKKEL